MQAEGIPNIIVISGEIGEEFIYPQKSMYGLHCASASRW